MKHYARLADTGTTVIKKGGANKQTLIEHIQLSADDVGTLTITDGIKSYVIDVIAGTNNPFCYDLVFEPGTDVTFTAGGANISVFVNYTNK